MWGNAWVTITHELTLGKTWLFLGWCVYMFGPSGCPPSPTRRQRGLCPYSGGEGAVGDGSGRKQTSVRARLAGSACPAKPSCSSFKTETTSSGEWDSPSRAEANPQMLGSMASNSRLKQTMRIINSLTNKRTKVPVLLRDPETPSALRGVGGGEGSGKVCAPWGL